MDKLPPEILQMILQKATDDMKTDKVIRLSVVSKTWNAIIEEIVKKRLTKQKIATVTSKEGYFPPSVLSSNSVFKLLSAVQVLNLDLRARDVALLPMSLETVRKLDISVGAIHAYALRSILIALPEMTELVYRFRSDKEDQMKIVKVIATTTRIRKLCITRFPPTIVRSIRHFLQMVNLIELDVQFRSGQFGNGTADLISVVHIVHQFLRQRIFNPPSETLKIIVRGSEEQPGQIVDDLLNSAKVELHLIRRYKMREYEDKRY